MQINTFIKKFREEGGFDALAEKYLPEQKKAFKAMGVPFVF
jgi:polar amino acid transport system substrate-binding protein